MGCLLGKEQEHITELSKTQLYLQSLGKRDPWWNMLRGADLSLAYMSELEERIRKVEVSNKINDKRNMKQKERKQEQDEKNRQNEKEIRCLEQEQRIMKQEERNRKQEKRNRDQEESNRKQQEMNMEQEQRNTVQEENNKHQEEKNDIQAQQNITQKETNRNHGDLVENYFLDTAVEDKDMIMNFQKDFKKLIDRFGVKYLTNDKETQTEKEP